MPTNSKVVENQPQIDGESENLRQSLLKKREELNKRENIINSKQIIEENKLKLNKEKIIADLFQMMRGAGVNLDDLSSIQKFLADLETRDPDLKDLFEYAVSSLMEEGGLNTEDKGLMNKFNNLGQETMMPRE